MRDQRGRRGAARFSRRPGTIVIAAVVVVAAAIAIARVTMAPDTASLRSTSASVSVGGPPYRQAPGPADGSDAIRSKERLGGGAITSTALDPSFFARGACVAFTPREGATRGETVFLDAGHGGIDPGGVGQTEGGTPVPESQVNLPVEMDAMRVLTGEGYRVVVSRTAQTTVLRLTAGDTDGRLLTVTGSRADVAARDVCANMGHANLLVGIYMDAGGYGEAGSVTTYDAVRPFTAANERFAELLQADVLARLNARGYQIPDGGVADDSGMGSTLTAAGAAYGHLILLGPAKAGYFTTPSQMPGALIEPLFLTDPFEAAIAASPSGQRLIADGIAAAVGQYFAVPSPEIARSAAQPEIESVRHDHVTRAHLTD